MLHYMTAMENSLKKNFQVTRFGQKRTVAASSIKELLAKGSQIFGSDVSKCVLAETGYPIMDDDVLANLQMNNTLLLIRDDEEWVEEGYLEKVQKVSNNFKVVKSLPLDSTENVDKLREAEVWNDIEVVIKTCDEDPLYGLGEACKSNSILKIDNIVSLSSTNTSEFTFCKVKEIVKSEPLPQFGQKMRMALEGTSPGMLNPSLFNAVVQHTVEFYRDLIPNFKGYGGIYDFIARKMVLKYPSLQRGGQNDDNWSAFKDAFGRRIRYLRYSESGKLSISKKNKEMASYEDSNTVLECKSTRTFLDNKDIITVLDNEDNRKTPPLVMPRYEIIIEEQGNNCLSFKSEEEFSEVIKLINMHYQKFSLATNAKIKHNNILAIRAGLQEIFPNLKSYFRTVVNLSIILEKLPCMVNGDMWLFLWGLLMEDQDLASMKKTFSDFRKVINVISNISNASITELEKFCYEETKIVKGAGTKTKSVIEYHDDIPFDKYSKYLDSTEIEAMKIVVFKRGGASNEVDVFHAIYIVGHGTKIFVPSCDLQSAFLVLFATYYLLSLNYPKIYAQVLGFMQTYALNTSPYKLLKSSGYLRLCSKYEEAFISLNNSK